MKMNLKSTALINLKNSYLENESDSDSDCESSRSSSSSSSDSDSESDDEVKSTSRNRIVIGDYYKHQESLGCGGFLVENYLSKMDLL
jgi:hypothetical protein